MGRPRCFHPFHLRTTPAKRRIPRLRELGYRRAAGGRLTASRKQTRHSSMPKSMQAAFCREPGRLVVEEVAVPTPQEGEALVKISRCGICGSDLHWYHGGGIPIPVVCPGHEISAVVSDVGAGVRGVKAG